MSSGVSAFDVAIVASSAVALICFIAKAICLVWAFVRTQKIVAILYLVFLMVSPVVPLVMVRLLGAERYAFFILYYGAGAGIVEAALFIWLVRSLIKRLSLTLDASTSTNPASGESQDWL